MDDYWQRMAEANIRPGLKTYSSIIEGYGRRGDHESCCKWLDQMNVGRVSPTVVTMNSLIHCCVKNSDAVGAENWFRRMYAGKLVPNSTSYGSIIEAYAKNADVQNAIRWLDYIERHFQKSKFQHSKHCGFETNIVTLIHEQKQNW